LIDFTLGKENGVCFRSFPGPLRKFVDHDHCQSSVYVEGMHGCFRYKLPLYLNQH
jgi:hypothetical protein